MIGYLYDRWWAWRNREVLRQLDEDAAFLAHTQRRLEAEMVEMYGPDWAKDAEARLAKYAATLTTDRPQA